jgi:hypothetical protein
LKNSSQKAKKDQQQKDKELETAAKGKTKGVRPPGPSVALILLGLKQLIDCPESRLRTSLAVSATER